MYRPKPGDLIFASSWYGGSPYSHDRCEVIEYLGSTSAGWQFANFYDKSAIGEVTKDKYFGDLLQFYCKFGIHRLNKRLKAKFHVGDLVEVYSKNYVFQTITKEPVLCEILNIKLKYNYYRKKCYIGYGLKIIHENKYVNRVNSLYSALSYIEEREMHKFINYNKIWNIFK